MLYCLHLQLKTSVDLLSQSQDLLEPLENGNALILILAITEHNFNQQDKDILAHLVRLGGANACKFILEASGELASSVKVTTSPVDHITSQAHQLSDESLDNLAQILVSDVEGVTVPQDISREQLKIGANKAQRVNLVIFPSGFCEPQRSAFVDVRDCLQMLNPVRTRSSNRQNSRRLLFIEYETFTPLIFTTIGRMDEECLRYQGLIDLKKGNYLRLLHSAVTTRNDLFQFFLAVLQYELVVNGKKGIEQIYGDP